MAFVDIIYDMQKQHHDKHKLYEDKDFLKHTN